MAVRNRCAVGYLGLRRRGLRSFEGEPVFQNSVSAARRLLSVETLPLVFGLLGLKLSSCLSPGDSSSRAFSSARTPARGTAGCWRF